ncbi:DUF7319 domain-containing protein [Haloarchaeobius sp. DT45]|uniref:DUF7319 domain-containing protein n=1 Tax=Haloarchaeobius sp. DT45 TaxID=3446116 RepID=UPI003F6B9642
MTRPRRADGGTDADVSDPSPEELRRRVEETYDFENFGPQDMAEMSYEEWDAVFDPDTWIVGEELLDRVEQDLNTQVASRDVFAIVERVRHDSEHCLLAYSDEGYALVFPDGSVDGFGTVLRDVQPTVALCSMDEYEPSEPPAQAVLPHPDEVPEGSGELGNWMLQAVAFVLTASALALFGGAAFVPNPGGPGDAAIAKGVMVVAGIVFLLTAGVLFLTVANARLSDRFRAKEYKDRLRAIGLEDGERPEFLPPVEPLDGFDPATRRELDESTESAANPDS